MMIIVGAAGARSRLSMLLGCKHVQPSPDAAGPDGVAVI
jgi:hypothetical protein